METFAEIKPFVDNSLYQKQRGKSLSRLDINTIPVLSDINSRI